MTHNSKLLVFLHFFGKEWANLTGQHIFQIKQVFRLGQCISATEKGRDTLFSAINKRQDDVYRRLYDEFNSLSLVSLNKIKYHRSCYKAYTSKRNKCI
jgi:hypothetical protein